MKQFLWQIDIVGVGKFILEGLNSMLGADSDAHELGIRSAQSGWH